MTDVEVLAEEYDALRRGVGAYRYPRDVVAVSGPQAVEYLQGQLSQDMSSLPVGGSATALLLEPDGKLCALVRTTRTATDSFILDTDAGWGGAVVARLQRFKLRTKVELEQADWECVALRGADVPTADRIEAPGGTFALPVEWNGTTGVDLLGPGADGLVPEGARWCGDDAWEALRVEAGIPKMGAELDERTIAAEAGLVERAVSFTKGCYTGQELIARLDARGNRVARRLCGVVAPALDAADAGSLTGTPLSVAGRDREAGRCTSAAWCPGLHAVAGLAYLHRSVEVPADLVGGLRALPLPLVAGTASRKQSSPQ